MNRVIRGVGSYRYPVIKTEHPSKMAYPQKIACDMIVGMARPINNRLIELVGFDFFDPLRQHFRRELRNWFNEI
jgi:hypothetical protein